MMYELTKSEKETALLNAVPQPPRKYELGGDYYYRCHWISCNEPLKRWWRYCPACGAAILWEEE